MLEKIKNYLIEKWFIIINYLVIIISYSMVYGKEGLVIAQTLLGLWIFISIAYSAFKWFLKK